MNNNLTISQAETLLNSIAISLPRKDDNDTLVNPKLIKILSVKASIDTTEKQKIWNDRYTRFKRKYPGRPQYWYEYNVSSGVGQDQLGYDQDLRNCTTKGNLLEYIEKLKTHITEKTVSA